jgi:hypothetical protein
MPRLFLALGRLGRSLPTTAPTPTLHRQATSYPGVTRLSIWAIGGSRRILKVAHTSGYRWSSRVLMFGSQIESTGFPTLPSGHGLSHQRRHRMKGRVHLCPEARALSAALDVAEAPQPATLAAPAVASCPSLALAVRPQHARHCDSSTPMATAQRDLLQ